MAKSERSSRRLRSPYAGVAAVLAKELDTVEKRLAVLRDVPKAAFLGSARVRRGEPYWTAAHAVAERFARGGWWIITGGGPGIMEAATAGAGPAATIALRIQIIDSLRRNGVTNGFGPTTFSVDLTQLFTRKLIMIWEATCFVAFPGGFGTLDEIFELLTMMQTQLAPPRPILLIERPGDTFWAGLDRHLWQKLTKLGLIDSEDQRFLIRATPDDPVISRIIEAGRAVMPSGPARDGNSSS